MMQRKTSPGALKVLVAKRHAFTLGVGQYRLEEIEPGPHWSELSVAWSEVPDRPKLDTWLDACLPESGARESYKTRATLKQIEHGIGGTVGDPGSALWANTDAEYPGAVEFESIDTIEAPPHYEALTDDEIGDRLYQAWRIASGGGKGQPRSYPERRMALPGMRGKIGLALIDGRWHAAHGTALSTWIAKHEERQRLHGEAGIESLCQEAIRLLGVASARTLSRVLGDQQCVLSERADRRTDPRTKHVTAIHQEDFAQATAWPGVLRDETGTESEPRWPAAYALLRTHAAPAEQESESDRLTRTLAATWILGHTALHRKNIGFTHHHDHGMRHIRLAPMYDVSSAVGTALDQTLAIGIARQQRPSEIGIEQWLAHAHECGLDPDRTLAIVRDVARRTPDAIATARTTVRERDENRHQQSVDRRIEAILRHAHERQRSLLANGYTQSRKSYSERQSPGLDPDPAQDQDRARST